MIADVDVGQALAEARLAITKPPIYGWGRPVPLTVREAAALLGVNRVTLCNIEAGKRSVKVIELAPFAAALKTTEAKLLARAAELAAARKETVTPTEAGSKKNVRAAAAARKGTVTPPSSAASKKNGRPPSSAASKKNGRPPSSAASKKNGPKQAGSSRRKGKRT